ncbi:WD40-repeat-containing domain protein [Paraphoma chrysanthemicola]|uniref:WD40-repeat-containing domain protein n=1 Tax=Paraphoma chrysanthemicola TaxID=798071 RepID=A0A8K0QZW0_9PLEO|nr:WD40-repeat-containing domain protein [Paraphoma chrysanthemicola]
MAKRKRDAVNGGGAAKALKSRKEETASGPKQAAKTDLEGTLNGTAVASKSKLPATSTHAEQETVSDSTTVQIITGSYERVLHGFAATIPHGLITGQDEASASETSTPKLDFTDTFLFNAHASSIRCLALSPLSEETSKVMLATGSTDERINLYSLSTAPPAISKSQPKLPSLHGASITENPKNKELGSLLHHSSNITALYFPTRTLSTIKAPIPKPQGRPSGDTAGPGEVPSGINDFAVHPSMKLMVSVGKGEKCMRLWNLVTGKKAGVLNFGRNILSAVGEGRFGSGEGRRVIWDKEGEEFAVAFERGVVVFSIDSKPKAKIAPTPRTKIHQMHYLPSDTHATTLLVSTEDGRVLLYDTSATSPASEDVEKSKDSVPSSKLVAQIGGPGAGISGRVKDFEVFPLTKTNPTAFLVITGSSDGTVRIWSLNSEELKDNVEVEQDKGFSAKQVGRLLGTYTTGTRITCLKAYTMTGKPEEDENENDDVIAADKDDASSSDESE